MVAEPGQERDSQLLANHVLRLRHAQVVAQDAAHAFLKCGLCVHDHEKHASGVEPEEAAAVLLRDRRFAHAGQPAHSLQSR